MTTPQDDALTADRLRPVLDANPGSLPIMVDPGWGSEHVLPAESAGLAYLPGGEAVIRVTASFPRPGGQKNPEQTDLELLQAGARIIVEFADSTSPQVFRLLSEALSVRGALHKANRLLSAAKLCQLRLDDLPVGARTTLAYALSRAGEIKTADRG